MNDDILPIPIPEMPDSIQKLYDVYYAKVIESNGLCLGCPDIWEEENEDEVTE